MVERGETFSWLVSLLEEESQERQIIVTTWSKELSDVIRAYIGEVLSIDMPEDAYVDISMQSRDMIANAFSHASDRFIPVNSTGDVGKVLSDSKIPVLLQYDMLKTLKPFKIRKGLSSDTTSAYFANLFKAGKYVKLTNVNGVYGWEVGVGQPLSTVSTADLRAMWKTCVDITLADFLDKIKMNCYVMNGKKLPNLKNFLQSGTGIHTCVEPL